MTERIPIVFDVVLDQQRNILQVHKGFIQWDNIGGKLQPRMSVSENGPQEIFLSVAFFISNTVPADMNSSTGGTLDVYGSGFVEGMTGVFDDGINTPVAADSVTFDTSTHCIVAYPVCTQTSPTILTLTRPDAATASVSVGVFS